MTPEPRPRRNCEAPNVNSERDWDRHKRLAGIRIV
jgi:hypothetical protein